MRRYILAATSATVAAVALFSGTVAAQPDDKPVSGDVRATAVAGNVVEKDCADLFKGSSAIGAGDITSSVDNTNTYLDILTVANDVEVAGVIVKGGPAYNVYKAADLGILPWLDLHAPLVSSGKPAQISHWFVCGVKKTTTTTTTTTTTGTETTTSTSSTSSTSSTTSGTSSSSSSSSGAATATTTSAAVSPVADEGDLASTGFNGGWLIAVAALLLLAGGGLLLVLRLRTSRR
jgi:hypothetical protein